MAIKTCLKDSRIVDQFCLPEHLKTQIKLKLNPLNPSPTFPYSTRSYPSTKAKPKNSNNKNRY